MVGNTSSTIALPTRREDHVRKSKKITGSSAKRPCRKLSRQDLDWAVVQAAADLSASSNKEVKNESGGSLSDFVGDGKELTGHQVESDSASIIAKQLGNEVSALFIMCPFQYSAIDVRSGGRGCR